MLLLLSASPALADQPQACPEVEIGSAQTYACLNQRLRQFTNPPAPGAVSTPLATDPATRTGSASEAGTRERLGANFGKSATPQRPPPVR